MRLAERGDAEEMAERVEGHEMFGATRAMIAGFMDCPQR
jgi:hypothetical protein